jgi:arylsulfatase A-like enzyme
VQHHDLCTTLVNYLGIKPPYELEGQDLMPILAGRTDKVRDYATCGFLMNLWCDDGEYVLICGLEGEYPSLFDMKNDPYQQENLAADRPQIVKRLHDLILADAGGGPILPNWGEIVVELAYRKT